MTTRIRLYIPLDVGLAETLPDASQHLRDAIRGGLASYSEVLGSFDFDENAIVLEVISDYRDGDTIRDIILESLDSLPDCPFEFEAEIDSEYELDDGDY